MQSEKTLEVAALAQNTFNEVAMISRRKLMLSVPAVGALYGVKNQSMVSAQIPSASTPTLPRNTWDWTKSLGMTYNDFLAMYGMYTWEYGRYWWEEDFYTMWVTFSLTTTPVVTSLELEADDYKYFKSDVAEIYQEKMLPIDSQLIRTRDVDGVTIASYQSDLLAEVFENLEFDDERYSLDYVDKYEAMFFAKRGQFEVSVQYKDGSKESDAIHSVGAWIKHGKA